MDDKFNQWCIKLYGMEYSKLPENFKSIAICVYKIELLDAEITELKTKIAALENK